MDEGTSMMTTAEQLAVQAPKHPLHALTTYELRDYRRELEHAVERIAPGAPAAADLRRLLDDVLAEQEERQRIRRSA
jgi:hypothetical protein